MKKGFLFFVVVFMMSLVGCGKGNTDVETNSEYLVEPYDTEGSKVVDDSESYESDVKELYVNGGELHDVVMGTLVNGEQKDLCSVEMPLNYLFGACYTGEGGSNMTVVGASGSSTLDSVIKDGVLDENEDSISFVNLLSVESDGSRISYYVKGLEWGTYGEEKDSKGATELTSSSREACYYTPENDFEDNDLVVLINISTDAYLEVSYRGPLSGTLSDEEIATMICNLVS